MTYLHDIIKNQPRLHDILNEILLYYTKINHFIYLIYIKSC